MKWRDTTFTEVTEHYDSPQEEFAADDARVTQLVDIRPGTYEARLRAALDFMGWQSVQRHFLSPTGDWVYYLSRVTPMPYAYLPVADLNFTNRPLYCVGIPRGQGLGVATKHPLFNTANYPVYRMTLTFRPLPYDIKEDNAVVATDHSYGFYVDPNPLIGFADEGDALAVGNSRYIYRTMDYGGGMISIRGSMLQYVPYPPDLKEVSVQEALPIPDPFINVQYRWYNVPVAAVPFGVFGNLMNTVNDRTFDGFPPQTMLFQGARATNHFGPLNDKFVDVHFSFRVRYNVSHRVGGTIEPNFSTPLGWNYIRRTYVQDAGIGAITDFWLVSSDGTVDGTLLFQKADFRTLFQPPQP